MAFVISVSFLYGCVKSILLSVKYKFIAVFQVENGYQIPYLWKSKGNKKLNLDVVIRDKTPRPKLFYVFEVKTNFEDGFRKYRNEEKNIYHHRTKVYPRFKYYYLSRSTAPKSILKKYNRDINTLIRRKELYILNNEENKLPCTVDFLHSIVTEIKELEDSHCI